MAEPVNNFSKATDQMKWMTSRPLQNCSDAHKHLCVSSIYRSKFHLMRCKAFSLQKANFCRPREIQRNPRWELGRPVDGFTAWVVMCLQGRCFFHAPRKGQVLFSEWSQSGGWHDSLWVNNKCQYSYMPIKFHLQLIYDSRNWDVHLSCQGEIGFEYITSHEACHSSLK